METGVTDLMTYLRESFGMEEVDLRSYSPLALAYIGDGVYDLVIRSLLVGRGNTQAARLHKKASRLVNAGAQSALVGKVIDCLTEEELTVYKRGRNAHSPTMAKHATMSDYRRATGLEALMGYLYLAGQTERLVELVKLGLELEES